MGFLYWNYIQNQQATKYPISPFFHRRSLTKASFTWDFEKPWKNLLWASVQQQTWILFLQTTFHLCFHHLEK